MFSHIAPVTSTDFVGSGKGAHNLYQLARQPERGGGVCRTSNFSRHTPSGQASSQHNTYVGMECVILGALPPLVMELEHSSSDARRRVAFEHLTTDPPIIRGVALYKCDKGQQKRSAVVKKYSALCIKQWAQEAARYNQHTQLRIDQNP